MIKFNCPGCGRQFSVNESNAGKVAKCNTCGRQFQVPAVGETSPPPPIPTAMPPKPPADQKEYWDPKSKSGRSATPRFPWQKPLTEKDKRILDMPGVMGVILRNPFKCALCGLVLFSLILSICTPGHRIGKPQVGDEARLDDDRRVDGDLILAVNLESGADGVFFVPMYTRVKVLQTHIDSGGDGWFCVRILSGPAAGRTGGSRTNSSSSSLRTSRRICPDSTGGWLPIPPMFTPPRFLSKSL